MIGVSELCQRCCNFKYEGDTESFAILGGNTRMRFHPGAIPGFLFSAHDIGQAQIGLLHEMNEIKEVFAFQLSATGGAIGIK